MLWGSHGMACEKPRHGPCLSFMIVQCPSSPWSLHWDPPPPNPSALCSFQLRDTLIKRQTLFLERVYAPYILHISSKLHVLPHVNLIYPSMDKGCMVHRETSFLPPACGPMYSGFPPAFLTPYGQCPSRLGFLHLNEKSRCFDYHFNTLVCAMAH